LVREEEVNGWPIQIQTVREGDGTQVGVHWYLGKRRKGGGG
jgi:hypothetical protein